MQCCVTNEENVLVNFVVFGPVHELKMKSSDGDDKFRVDDKC